jgi:hypothetical protein
MNLRKILCASVLVFANGCATYQPIPFSEIVERNQGLIQEYPERINQDIEADCLDGLCTLPETNLSTLVTLINGLQDDVESRIDISNNVVTRHLNHSEYANERYKETIELMEKSSTRDSAIAIAKQIATAGVCAMLLTY